MIKIRKSQDRGHIEYGWLESRHTFSFGDYYNSEFMGFSVLRVINEDTIAGGTGFPLHSHRDMEILTYVIAGALEHKDSLKNSIVIRPGEVQRMSAGTGVQHSEFNPNQDQKTHFLQIWIVPNQVGIPPSYEQKFFGDHFAHTSFVLVASQSGRNGSLTLHQDADIYVGRLQTNADLSHVPVRGRSVWVQMVKGDLNVNDRHLHQGDGVAIRGEERIYLQAQNDTEFLLFDLP